MRRISMLAAAVVADDLGRVTADDGGIKTSVALSARSRSTGSSPVFPISEAVARFQRKTAGAVRSDVRPTVAVREVLKRRDRYSDDSRASRPKEAQACKADIAY